VFERFPRDLPNATYVNSFETFCREPSPVVLSIGSKTEILLLSWLWAQLGTIAFQTEKPWISLATSSTYTKFNASAQQD